MAEESTVAEPTLEIAFGMQEPKLQKKENNINAVSWRGGCI